MTNRKAENRFAPDKVSPGRSFRATPVTIRLAPHQARPELRTSTMLRRPPPANDAGPDRPDGAVRVPASPMLWTGANARGNVVFGVAPSTTAVSRVEVVAVVASPAGSYRSARRTLTPQESRQLAGHLMAAADEAERREALQLVATA